MREFLRRGVDKAAELYPVARHLNTPIQQIPSKLDQFATYTARPWADSFTEPLSESRLGKAYDATKGLVIDEFYTTPKAHIEHLVSGDYGFDPDAFEQFKVAWRQDDPRQMRRNLYKTIEKPVKTGAAITGLGALGYAVGSPILSLAGGEEMSDVLPSAAFDLGAGMYGGKVFGDVMGEAIKGVDELVTPVGKWAGGHIGNIYPMNTIERAIEESRNKWEELNER